MRLFQAPLDTCLCSPFFASLSVPGLHFTVYAVSILRRKQSSAKISKISRNTLKSSKPCFVYLLRNLLTHLLRTFSSAKFSAMFALYVFYPLALSEDESRTGEPRALEWTLFVGTSVDTFVRRFVEAFVESPSRAENKGKSTLVGAVVGALVDALVAICGFFQWILSGRSPWRNKTEKVHQIIHQIIRKRAEYCFESTVSEKRTH